MTTASLSLSVSLSLTHSLTRALSVPFSTCLSRALSVPASHLPLMSLFPCAQSCLSSTPLTPVSPQLCFSPRIALFGTPLHLPTNHFYCVGICVCLIGREGPVCVCVCVCVCVSIFISSISAGICLEEQHSSLYVEKLATTTIFTHTPASLSSFSPDKKVNLLPSYSNLLICK